jgi:MFS family permease
MRKVTARSENLGTVPVISSPFQHRPNVRKTNYNNSASVRERLREQVLLSCLIMFAEGFYGTQIFPYGAWMVEELQGTAKNVGLYTGSLMSMQSFGMLLSAYLWANVSNRKGRRFCLLTGLAFGVLCSAVQAFSRSYWLVAAARLLAGLTNSNLSIMRTALRESFQHERSEDTWAFSTLSVAFSASCMAGPSLGGLLYGLKLPLGGYENPWSASMLSGTLLYVLCLTFTWWRLPETAFLGKKRGQTTMESRVERLKSEGAPGQPLLRDKNFILLLIMGGGHSYVFTGWEVVYPLFARLPAEWAGQEWQAADIGVTFFVGSCGLCLYSLLLYPMIADRLAITRVWYLSWIVPLIVFPIFPRVVTWACDDGMCSGTSETLVTSVNYFAQIFISILLGSGFITIQVLLNSYVGAMPHSRSALALANSMLVSMQALVRAASPMVSGTSFAFGLTQEDGPWHEIVGRSLPFDCLAVVGLVTCVFCAVVFESRTSEPDSATVTF